MTNTCIYIYIFFFRGNQRLIAQTMTSSLDKSRTVFVLIRRVFLKKAFKLRQWFIIYNITLRLFSSALSSVRRAAFSCRDVFVYSPSPFGGTRSRCDSNRWSTGPTCAFRCRPPWFRRSACWLGCPSIKASHEIKYRVIFSPSYERFLWTICRTWERKNEGQTASSKKKKNKNVSKFSYYLCMKYKSHVELPGGLNWWWTCSIAYRYHRGTRT